jgi:hypothetical protein
MQTKWNKSTVKRAMLLALGSMDENLEELAFSELHPQESKLIKKSWDLLLTIKNTASMEYLFSCFE